jgi:carbamoyltransferase
VRILGLSALYHDSAAALIEDGRIVAAAQEERFTRKKHDSGFPHNAIRFCQEFAGCSLDDVDRVVFYDKPFLKFERLLETYLAFAPRGFQSFRTAMPVWLKEKLFQKDLLLRELRSVASAFDGSRLMFAEHHQSHAASAFFPSPFEEAVVLTMDGVGEWATTSAAIGKGNKLEVIKEIHFPHSLGLLYSAFTYYTGFRVNSGEYKLMGLAPYGVPRFAKLIRERLIDIKGDGSFRLNQDYFDYATGLRMTNRRFDELFGRSARRPDLDPLEQFHMDIAASIQEVTEDAVLRLCRALARETGQRNLCLAGGVALNCVANGKVLRDGAFENIWIQPAAGDAGGALGAALAAHYADGTARRDASLGGRDSMQGSFLGPVYGQQEIERRLLAAGARFEVLDDQALIDCTVDALVVDKAVGWFQGRMEFGPRALGARSVSSAIRARAKCRKRAQPEDQVSRVVPALRSRRSCVSMRDDWFDLRGADSPYMLLVAEVREDRLRPLTPEDKAALFGIEKLNVRSLRSACCHPRRLFRADPDRACAT